MNEAATIRRPISPVMRPDDIAPLIADGAVWESVLTYEDIAERRMIETTCEVSTGSAIR